MFEEVPLTEAIEVTPVVTTGRRWATPRENEQAEEYYRRFPEARDDPRRRDYGNSQDFPPPFARGGGLFPVLLLMDDGRLCCAMRTGSPHAGSGGEVSLSFSSDRGRTWSDYVVAVQGDPEAGLDRRNQSFGQAADGALVLAFGVSAGMDARGSHLPSHFRSMEVIRSADDGQTWSEPVVLGYPDDILLHPHGQMRRLEDGALVFNARGYYDRAALERDPALPQRMTYLYRSQDGGRSWQAPTLIRAGWSETGFLPLRGGHWVGYVRSNERANRIAHSYDGGYTWTRWEPGAFHEGATDDPAWGRVVNHRFQGAAPGSVAALPGDKVLITYGYRAYPFGCRAIVSRDGGDTFDTGREYILSDTAYHPDCGYTSTVCFEDGTIVTTDYTIKDIAHPEWGTACLAYRYHHSLFD